MNTTLFLNNGQLCETILFNNGISETYFSDYLHRINRICYQYGWDFENWSDFRAAQKLI